MSTNTSNSLYDAIRGGQIIKHYIAMFQQVFWWVVGAGGFFFMVAFAAIMYVRSSSLEFFNWFNWLQAWYLVEFVDKPQKTIYYFEKFGHGFEAKAFSIYHNDAVNYYADAFINNMFWAWIISSVFFVMVVVGIVRLFTGKGKSQVENELIRGGELVTAKELSKHLKKLASLDKEKYGPGNITLDGITIPFSFEPQGTAVFGAPGSGKTQLYMMFCDAARKGGHRAIINDRSGTLAEKFYREGDIILNPLDTRCAPWSLFSECHHKHDYDRIATILFPKANGDPFWYEAPRMIFVAMAMKEAKKDKPSIHHLASKVTTCSVDELVALCANTLAQTLIDKDVIKQTNSLRGVIVTKLQAFLLFEDHLAQGFSIGDWVANEDHSGWIFITSNKDQEATLKPLITSWLEIASSSILSLKPDIQRRLWLLFDELHTLDKVASLASTLAELRKYGGCGLIGFQGYKQAVEIYGPNGVDALIDSCSTGIYFRQNAAASASFASQQIGKADSFEATSTLSYGASDVRDGQNHGQQRHLRELVLPSEMQALPDLTAYIRFGRGIPVGKFQIDYISRPDIAQGFIEDTAKLIRLDDIVTNPNRVNADGFDESPDRFNEPEKDLNKPADKEKDKDKAIVDPLGSFDIPTDTQNQAESNRGVQDQMTQIDMNALTDFDNDMSDGR
jgi:type IV conjugative transfer system coupling protein TraD